MTEEKDQRLVFLQEVGNSNYELLESLLQRRELEEVELKELRAAMEKHYQPKRLVLAERFGLMSMVQKLGKGLHEYYAELQKAANKCCFKTIKNHRDADVAMVFIGGLASVDTRKRLLEIKELTSKKALEQAETFERLGANAAHLKEAPRIGVAQVRGQRDGYVQWSTGRSKTRKNAISQDNKSAREKRRRWVCGAPGHVGYDCFKRDKAYCKVGKKKGHYTAVCRATKSDKTKVSRQVHRCVEPPGSSDSEEDMVTQGVNSVRVASRAHCRRAELKTPVKAGWKLQRRCVTRQDTARGGVKVVLIAHEKENGLLASDMEGTTANSLTNTGIEACGLHLEPPRMLNIEVDGKVILFEIDTGASMSIIDEKTWHILGAPKLEQTEVEATAYNNERTTFQGKLPFRAKFKRKAAALDVHVLRNAKHSLCGKDMIKALQIDCGPYYT